MTLLGAPASSSLRWESIPPTWIVVLLIVPAVLLAVRFVYRREAAAVRPRTRVAMGAFRMSALLLALLALWGPYRETVEGEAAKRNLVLCIDTSQSMGFHDGYRGNEGLARELRTLLGLPAGADLEALPRLRVVKDLLAKDPAFLEKLAAKFRLEVYTFDSDKAGVMVQREDESAAEAAERIREALPRLQATGTVTRIGKTLREVVSHLERRNEPVAGIVLFSDGRHTGGAPGPIEEARRAAEGTREGIAIYPVAIGDPAAAINIGVSRVDAPEVVLAGDDVTFTVSVHARGLAGRTAVVEAHVLDGTGEVAETLIIDAEPFELPGEDEPAKKITFRYRFDRHGTYDLKIGVRPEPAEAVVGDNYQRHVIHVVKLKMRVLFVTSKPNFTYRFLKEALLRAEETIDANVLHLGAEPDWPQEASRGVEPIDAFPRTKAELARYDVVHLMDVAPDARGFAPPGDDGLQEVLTNLEGWVKAGGGLVLQAGLDDYYSRFYERTPLMALLPVVPSRHSPDAAGRTIQTDILKKFKLTPAGAEHPIMQILREPDENREFWDGDSYASEYYWYTPVERAKSSATVLARRRDRDGNTPLLSNQQPHPLMVVQDYGLGKVLWVGTDELWRMRANLYNENLYYWRFWSGAIRHLATYRLLGGNKRIKIWVDRADGRYRVGDVVGIEAKFLDENFEPLAPDDTRPETVTQRLTLVRPDGAEDEVLLHAVPTDPPEGLYRTKLTARVPGTYRLVAAASGGEEPAKASFIIEETTIEMRDPLMDKRTLEEIAKASRGRVLSPGEFRNVLDLGILPETSVLRTGDTHRVDLWDRGWVLWLFTALLAAEWILRRKNLLL